MGKKIPSGTKPTSHESGWFLVDVHGVMWQFTIDQTIKRNLSTE